MSHENITQPDTRLDDSERSFIRRAIEAAGKDPNDPAILAEYTQSYVRLRSATRFAQWEPVVGSTPQ